MNGDEFMDKLIKHAVEQFWINRENGTQSAQHDKAFLLLIKKLLIDKGLNEENLFIKEKKEDKKNARSNNNELKVPGFYRDSKEWDLVYKIDGKVILCIEFKSQVGSYGNNENNWIVNTKLNNFFKGILTIFNWG